MKRVIPDFTVVIPARYASTRLPGKPLLDIAGLPMVVRVAMQAKNSGARDVIVATDHEEIMKVVKTYGIASILTDEHHQSGTDRLAEVIQRLKLEDHEVIVNVQGDEPLVEPDLIRSVALNLVEHETAAMATAAHIADAGSWSNPNTVKVVLDLNGFALYFSRALIPYVRYPKGYSPLRHVGIYAYRAAFLHDFTTLPPCLLEETEALEQLRALYHGYRISVHVSDRPHVPGVDTEEELAIVRAFFQSNSGEIFCE